MFNFFYEYFFIISAFGFGVLLIFSIMSFANCECLQIKSGKHTNSGILLITNSFVYLIIAIIMKACQISAKREKSLKRKEYDINIYNPYQLNRQIEIIVPSLEHELQSFN